MPSASSLYAYCTYIIIVVVVVDLDVKHVVFYLLLIS